MRGIAPAAVEVTLAIDLRRQWPFAAGCGGALRFRASDDGRVAMVATAADEAAVAVLVGASGRAELRAVAMRSGQGVECVVRPHRSDGLPGRSRQNVSLRRIAYADVRARSTPRSRGDVRSASIVSGVEL